MANASYLRGTVKSRMNDMFALTAVTTNSIVQIVGIRLLNNGGREAEFEVRYRQG